MNRLAQGLARFLEAVLGYVFLVIAVAIIVLVILRYFFSTTIVGGQEFVVFCFIYTTAIGAAVLLAKGEHIAVQVFLNFLSARSRRRLRRFNYSLVALLNGVLIALSIPWIQSVGLFPSPVLRVPQGVVLVALPIGCTLVALYAVWMAVADPQPCGRAGEEPS
ncbi:MAG: TRAP transporter small permease subunit [Zetaproteobacteria bacterium]|nr:MAG: TRAP transporter small permease subunit [Zetaproteobacteria bacterium]